MDYREILEDGTVLYITDNEKTEEKIKLPVYEIVDIDDINLFCEINGKKRYFFNNI